MRLQFGSLAIPICDAIPHKGRSPDMFCRFVFDFPVRIFTRVAEVGTVVATSLGASLGYWS